MRKNRVKQTLRSGGVAIGVMCPPAVEVGRSWSRLRPAGHAQGASETAAARANAVTVLIAVMARMSA
jgi:hypothetical protein